MITAVAAMIVAIAGLIGGLIVGVFGVTGVIAGGLLLIVSAALGIISPTL